MPESTPRTRRLLPMRLWLILGAVALGTSTVAVLATSWILAQQARLHLAVGAGDLATAATLIDEGEDIERQISYPREDEGEAISALMVAASTDNPEMIRMLLGKGADIDAENPLGRTALNLAATTNAMAAVEELLANGADLEIVCQFTGTALMAAVSAGSDAVALRLINAGADPNASDRRGGTPLSYACRGECGVEILDALIAAGADINAPHPRGQTLFHAVANAYGDMPSKIAWLQERGVDLDQADLRGTTPLMEAAQSNPALVRSLLDAGANIHARDNTGQTALHYAATRFNPDTTRVLLLAGADPRLRAGPDHTGSTPSASIEDAFGSRHPRARAVAEMLRDAENGVLPDPKPDDKNEN